MCVCVCVCVCVCMYNIIYYVLIFCICIASVYVYNIVCICAYACACTATWYYFNYLLERYFYYCRVKAEEGITCYMDDPELPIYSQVSIPYGRHQLIYILLAKNNSQSKVCSTRPLTVIDNATFIKWFTTLVLLAVKKPMILFAVIIYIDLVNIP